MANTAFLKYVPCIAPHILLLTGELSTYLKLTSLSSFNTLPFDVGFKCHLLAYSFFLNPTKTINHAHLYATLHRVLLTPMHANNPIPLR